MLIRKGADVNALDNRGKSQFSHKGPIAMRNNACGWNQHPGGNGSSDLLLQF
ncbi:MAG: hypothetical protein GXP53_06425 [Deltaproteobacteria bacterium]|nr:hypothetical protein [Deltaproteobacteria bacterium]